MDPISSIPAAVAILVALATCLIVANKFGPPDGQGRFLTIDGLRGYLAFFAFLHHSIIWYFYLKTNQWVAPPSNLYAHFGQTGVSFFFMITGFLFFSKILDGKTREIDWLRFYVSRLMRLMPLYCMAMIALLLIVFALSGAEIHDPIRFIISVIQWMSFTILGSPDINDIKGTALILAGVTWSLPYEWFFYLLLPGFALINQVRVSWIYVVISSVTLISIIVINSTSPYHWLSFAGGISAAYLIRYNFICEFLRRRISSFTAILLITLTISLYPSAHGLMQIIMLSGAFIVIAGGNSIFGLLTNKISRTLGEMAYGIYLLHGLLLFVLFRFIIGFEKAKEFTPILHWMTTIGLVPFLIFLAYFCHKKIEHPALLKTNALTCWLRKKMNVKSLNFERI